MCNAGPSVCRLIVSLSGPVRLLLLPRIGRPFVQVIDWKERPASTYRSTDRRQRFGKRAKYLFIEISGGDCRLFDVLRGCFHCGMFLLLALVTCRRAYCALPVTTSAHLVPF